MTVNLFKKKRTILETRNKAESIAVEEKLKAAGIWFNSWGSPAMPVGGCGAKMRPQDWNGLKYEDKDDQRMTYRIEVLEEDAERAQGLL